MSDYIKLLPDNIANQIAAGEVIQRPASIVKELMENALDAGASKVTVIIKDAGKTLVRVIDNGNGMSAQDLRMSIERHATSKISTTADLFKIQTMGFRGEALASMAAVGELEINSRMPEYDLGNQLIVRGSEIVTLEPTACPIGTDVQVKQLFFNIPARRKFLKSDRTELNHIMNEFQRIVLAYPDVQFEFYHDDKLLFNLHAENLKRRIVDVLGNSFEEKLMAIEQETEPVYISGFVSTIQAARKGRNDQFFFVNGRYFRSPYFAHAVQAAYGGMVPQGSHNPFVIFMEIDPSKIDVNVHPSKQEIKFEDERIIYNYLKATVRQGVAQHHLVPTIDFSGSSNAPLEGPAWTQAKPNGAGTQPSSQNPGSNGGSSDTQHWKTLYEQLGHEQMSQADELVDLDKELFSEQQDRQSSNLDGPCFQTENSYIVCKHRGQLMLVDPYAAHMRILYDEMMASFSVEKQGSQLLAFPETIELSKTQAQTMDQVLEQLRHLGYDLSHFGDQTYVVHGLPASNQFVDYNIGQISEILDVIAEEQWEDSKINEHLATAMSKSLAMRKGKAISEAQQQQLVSQLLQSEQADRTPTGKVCMRYLTRGEIEKIFK